MNIPSEAFVVVASADALRDAGRELIAGDVVVVSRTAVEDKAEITIRKVAFDALGMRFDAYPDDGAIDPLHARMVGSCSALFCKLSWFSKISRAYVRIIIYIIK
ncbi:hypothetical protein HGG76_15040 [Ochrobactrum tritici]|uniref:Uncharacterized protein n=1 Tax=Brucella tritici TaxID=94626 RepID=A0A7X6FSG0_9HYPH|nr:hypothetical protein [Brucella tritici]